MNKMSRRKLIIFGLILLLLSTFTTAATLKGSVYNSSLELETDVLVEIDTTPVQKYLAKDSSYAFQLPEGKYVLTATKGFISTSEEIEISKEGEFIFDLFLLPDFTEEDDLWKDTEEDLFAEDEEDKGYPAWRYVLAGLIVLFLAYRLLKIRKKYGPLKKFRKNMKAEHKKTLEEHKKEIAQEPGYLERALKIIKEHDGRITQKQLRKEMLDLSEAKVSLILTELEHKGKVEKIKKGRGNVILLK